MTSTKFSAKNWLAQPDIADTSNIICGKDPGAGYGKAIYGETTIVTPAAYSLVRNRDIRHHETISKDGAWVKYVDGRSDLKDIQFFWGTAAIAQADHTLLHQDKSQKALLSLEGILADLAIANIPDNSCLWLSLSSHNPDKWGDEIKRRVGGVHSFEHKHPITREIVKKTVEIIVTGVYPGGGVALPVITDNLAALGFK